VSLRRVWIGSPNYSARNSSVQLVVLHTAQGARTYRELGNFFANPASGVSSHVGIDDSPGEVGEYVHRDKKAWTQANANPFAVAAELCAWAEWDTVEWHRHPSMLENAAAWIAEECHAFGIPVRRLSPQQAQDRVPGVCQHVDLGSLGGGHWDCGPGFPMDEVLAMAGGTAPPQQRRKGKNMIASTQTGQGYWTVTSDGAVGAFGDAQYKGGAFDLHEDVAGRQPMAPGTEIVGIAGKGNDGYWLYASDGGIFAFGSALYYGRPDRA
jgi:hypothetical protein